MSIKDNPRTREFYEAFEEGWHQGFREGRLRGAVYGSCVAFGAWMISMVMS